MPVLETPSRVWRRIQAADDLAVPSLPSLPGIDSFDDGDDEEPLPVFPSVANISASTTKKSTTTVRFADKHESFEFSEIQPITHQSLLTEDEDEAELSAEYSGLVKQSSPAPSDDLNKHVATRRIRTPSLTRSASILSSSPDRTPTNDEDLSLPNASRRSSTRLPEQDVSANAQPNTVQNTSKQSLSSSKSLSQSNLDISQSQQSEVKKSMHLATPQTAKRSFFLDVINSAAKPRPRLSMHTPISSQPARNAPAFGTPLGFRTPKPSGSDSFISTASSHDLTVRQPRINASFDHLTGAKGVGRFDATKLNTYLHGLNRRLVEENEELVKRLDGGRHGTSTILEADEDTKALEIAALEDQVKTLEAELEKERREKEKERSEFKGRIQEVEDGVNDVVEKLEHQLETAGNAKEQALSKARRAAELKEDAEERATRAEMALAKLRRQSMSPRGQSQHGSPVGSGTATTDHEDFKEALERVAELEAELRQSTSRCEELEEELRGSDDALSQLQHEKQASDRRLLSMTKRLENSEAMAEELGFKVQSLEEDLQSSQLSMETLLSELGGAQEETLGARQELENAKADIVILQGEVGTLVARCERLDQESRQMEEALEAGETQMIRDREELAVLNREVEKLRMANSHRSTRASTVTAVSSPANRTEASTDDQAEIDALEKELDDAHKEIGRLQHMLQDSPARTILLQAKETRIDVLEKENEDLLEKVRTLRVLLSKGQIPGTPDLLAPGTPARMISLPIPGDVSTLRNLPSFRAPKTPGGPLKEASWLQTMRDGDESEYLHRISMLERELAHANEKVDDKIDRLEEYGHGVIGLTEKLAAADSRIAFLTGEVKRLERREERQSRKARKSVICTGCGGTAGLESILISGSHSTLDASQTRMSEFPSSSSMKKVLQQLRKMKQDWEYEKKRLEGEREYLQGAADRLNQEADLAKRDADENQAVVMELDEARRTISDLEVQLSAERGRLKAISAERTRTVNEAKDIHSKLEQTQSDMDSIKDQLRKCKQENYMLEADLRSNAVVESKARHLQAKAAENAATIDQLRHDRDELAESQDALQRRYLAASERIKSLRQTLAESQMVHDDRRQQLDSHIAEIDDLKRELAWRDEELARERKFAGSHHDSKHMVALLDTEVRRLRSEAEIFAHDLHVLREGSEEKELRMQEEVFRAERLQMQLTAQIRELEAALERRGLRHIGESNEPLASSLELDALRAQHNKECKGLLVQINYLKAKYTRENAFRQGLAYQKQYLLQELSTARKSNGTLLASCAPHAPSMTPSPKRTLKGLVYTIMFLNRVKTAAEEWAEHRRPRELLHDALREVRRQRATTGQGARTGIGEPANIPL